MSIHKILMLVFLQFSVLTIIAQKYETCKKDQLVGVCDEKGNVLIPQIYQSIFPCFYFPELFLVEKNTKYGIIDKTNKAVLPIEYEFDIQNANPFVVDGDLAYFDSTSLIILKKKAKYGLINAKLQPVIPFVYDYLANYLYYNSPSFIAQKGNSFLLIDNKQKILSKSAFNDFAGFFIIDSYDIAYALFKSGKNWIFVDESGNEYMKAMVKTQSGADTLVKKYCRVRYHNKYAAFDYCGKLIAQGFDELSHFVKLYPEESYEYAAFSIKNKFGVLRSDGQQIIKPVYDQIDLLYITGQVVKVRLNGKEGIMDLSTGNEVVAPIYDDIWIFGWTNEVSFVKNNGKCALINNKGKLISDFLYDDIQTYQDSIYGARIGDKWGYINLKGQEVIPFEFDITEGFFNETVIPLMKNGKFGYISKSGKYITEFKYDKAEHFYYNTRARIIFNGKNGWIDKNGNESWE